MNSSASFWKQTPAIREIVGTALSEYTAEFQAQTTGQNPQQASDYAEKCLEQIKLDEQLLGLFDAIAEFTSAFPIGDGPLAEDMPLVEKVAELGLRLSIKTTLSTSAMQLIAGAIEQALIQDGKKNFLTRFLKQNAGNVQEHRIRQIEKGAKGNRNAEQDEESAKLFRP